MPCLNSMNTISRNPRHTYGDAIYNFNTSASLTYTTTVKQRYKKYNRTLSLRQALLNHDTIIYNNYIRWNGSIKYKKYPLKLLNREEISNTIVSAFHPIVAASTVLEEEEEVDVPKEDIELLDNSEFNRNFMEIVFARCKIRDFYKLMAETRLALQDLLDAFGDNKVDEEIKTKPAPSNVKKLVLPEVEEPKEVADYGNISSIDWSKIPASKPREITYDSEIYNIDSISSTETKAIGRRIIRKRKTIVEKPEVNSTVETIDIRENTKLDAERLHNRWGFLSNNRESLLTWNEECFLTRKAKVGTKIQELKKEIEKVIGRKITNEELANKLKMTTKEMKEKIKHADLARKTMIQKNMRLVFSIALSFSKMRPDWILRDMVGEGVFGLIRAIEGFDPDMGFKFSTYAHWWIKQSIARTLGEQSRVVKIPSHLFEFSSKVNKYCETCMNLHGKYPTIDEIANEFSTSIDKIAKIKNVMRYQTDLDAPLISRDPQSDSLSDSIADTSVLSPVEKMINTELTQEIDDILATLPTRERYVIRLRYGLDDGIERTLEEVGKCINVTRERVRQLELKGMRKLRQRGAILQEYGVTRAPSLSRSRSAIYKKSI